MFYVAALLATILAPLDGRLTGAILIGPDLNRYPADIQALAEGRVSFFDADRHLQVQPISHFVQIRFGQIEDDGSTVSHNEGTVFIDLVDGQRLAVQWLGADRQTLHVRHALLGEMWVNVEDLLALTRGIMKEPSRRLAGDLVVLANGDRIEGFVATVGGSNIEIQTEHADATIMLRADRVVGLYLNNPARPNGPTGHLVYLKDGSAVLASELEIADGQLLLETPVSQWPEPGLETKPRAQPDKDVRQIALEQVKRIDLASEAGRLVEVIELDGQVIAGGEVFTLPMPPQVLSNGVLLHAPVALAYELPERTAQFAATAELSIDSEDPDRSFQWADFQLIIRVDDRVLLRRRITGQDPRVSIRVPVHGRKLTIELDPGANGPVMDRLLLRDAILFVQRGDEHQDERSMEDE